LKLPVISGKEALKALERAGFVVVRQRGDLYKRQDFLEQSLPYSYDVNQCYIQALPADLPGCIPRDLRWQRI